MKNFVLLIFLLLISIVAVSQIKIVSFSEIDIGVSDCQLNDSRFGDMYYIIGVMSSDLGYDELCELSFDSNARIDYRCMPIDDNSNYVVFVYIYSKDAYYLDIHHPNYGFVKFAFPEDIKPGLYKMDLSCRIIDWQPVFKGNSYNVAVYDKNGQAYTTGHFITTSGLSYIRIKTDKNQYKQYLLVKSDKKQYKYMTTGKSEIEPLYVK